MFSKFKKVLVSLALASSLALAPMNVYADRYITDETAPSGEEGKVFTKVLVTGSQLKTRWTVEIPESILINLDTSISQPDKLNIYVRAAEDIPTGSSLTVTPAFAVNTDDTVTICAIGTQNNTLKTTTATLESLGITTDLLKFGTYDKDAFESGAALTPADSNIAAFTPPSKDQLKQIPINVNKAMATTAKGKIPTPGDSSQDPRIADGQQIGKITYVCVLTDPAT